MPPSRFTPELGERIVEHITGGLGVGAAGEHEGVPRSTLFDWMSRTDEPYLSFATAVRAARAKVQKGLIADHYDWASDNQDRTRDHRALLARLERQFPDDWGLRVNVRVEAEHAVLFKAIRVQLGEEIYHRVLAVAAGLDAMGEGPDGDRSALPSGDDPPR